MALIEIDYMALNSAVKSINKMGGTWGCYESYRSDIKHSLHGSLAEWQLAGNEPMGHAYVANARTEAENKRSDLENRKNEWTGLGTNLANYKAYVEQQDKAVAREFKNTSKQYTDYSGIGGAFTWLGDAFFSSIGVDFANRNKFTRGIADWGKRVGDDFKSWTQRNVVDYFKHGDGRYVLNIIGSVALTTASVIGVVLAFAAAPWVGCSFAYFAVSWIGVASSGVCAAISAFNTYHTYKENKKALRLADDPGRARFHGDVTSYTERVSKTKYSSPEEYQKHAKQANWIDRADKTCAVISMATSALTTFGTKTTNSVSKTGNVFEKKEFDFSGKNIKSNVLKTFGFKQSSEVIDQSITSSKEVIQFGDDVDEGARLVKTTSFTTEGVNESGLEFAKGKDSVLNQANQKTMNYTKKTISSNSTAYKTEYSSVVMSDNSNLLITKDITTTSTTTRNTLDYSRAAMSTSKADKLKYYESINDAIEKGRSVGKLKFTHNLEGIKTGFTAIGNFSNDLTSLDGKTGSEIVTDIVKKNKFVSSFDKYVYSLPTDSDADLKDYLKGIGGTNGGKCWSLFETLTGSGAA